MNVYRVDGRDRRRPTVVADGIAGPNGLVLLAGREAALPRRIARPSRATSSVFDVVDDGTRLANGRVFINTGGRHPGRFPLRHRRQSVVRLGHEPGARRRRGLRSRRQADRPHPAARALRQSVLRRHASATACSWRRAIRSIRCTSTPRARSAADFVRPRPTVRLSAGREPAGTHLSASRVAERWIPACAGIAWLTWIGRELLKSGRCGRAWRLAARHRPRRKRRGFRRGSSGAPPVRRIRSRAGPTGRPTASGTGSAASRARSRTAATAISLAIPTGATPKTSL